MQKLASHEFVDARRDWEIYRELSEFGVSGYKVSAKERDAIQDIQQEALAGNFDVLLVFMFAGQFSAVRQCVLRSLRSAVDGNNKRQEVPP